MNSMNLELENLDSIEAPMSNDFWYGVGIGVGIVAGVATVGALVVAAVALT